MNKYALKISSILFTFALTLGAVAQENKVANGSFETIDGKIKSPGELVEDESPVLEWEVPRDCPPADIFTSEAKKDEMLTPTNYRGKAEPYDGNNYAGILVYSEREAEPRQYLQAKLDDRLTANKEYCVKFRLSLSDLSKYAVNNLGIYISDKAPKQKDFEDEETQITPQIMHSRNIVHNEQFDWVTVCQTYVADGTERYITIGNFAKQDDVATEKMRRPREFRDPQTRDAYYYIDDVSVIATAHLDEPCFCEDEEEDDNQLQVVYTKNVADEIELEEATKIELKKIYFDSMEEKVRDEGMAKLNEIAEVMKANSEVKIVIIGHSDYIETAKSPEDISFKRATTVQDYLVGLGIDESRLSVEAKKDTEPASNQETAQGRAQNRRVEFKAQ